MPVYSLRAPNGKTYEIEGPAGATEAQVRAEILRRDPSAAGSAQASTTKVPQRKGVVDNITGALANLNRGLGFGDELAGGAGGLVNTARDIMRGQAGRNPQEFMQNVGQNMQASMAQQRAIEDMFSSEHPNIAALSRGTGAAATVAIPAGQAIQGGRMLNAARGAVTAAAPAYAMGFADRGSLTDRMKNANVSAGLAGLFGGTMGAMMPTVATPANAAKVQQKSNSDILKAIGVQPSIPQQIGGLAKNVEDLAMRAPVVGSAISGARGRQLEQLNRGVALTAIDKIGGSIPKNVKPGFDMVDHVDTEISKVYQQATDMVPQVNVNDPAFVADLSAINRRKVDLATSDAEHFNRIMMDRLDRLKNGVASGRMIKNIHSELGDLQAEAAKQGKSTFSAMLGDTRRALMGVVERADPVAGDLIKRADAAWVPYSIMNDAAAAASAKGGVFSPGQLQTQVRAAGKRLGSNMTGKGKAPLQDIATAASQVLPDQFGNPGTANAIALGSAGVGAFTNPVQTAAIGGGLVAGATPYWLSARKVIETLPPNAGVVQQRAALQQLQKLGQYDPKVAQLASQFAASMGFATTQMPAQ